MNIQKTRSHKFARNKTHRSKLWRKYNPAIFHHVATAKSFQFQTERNIRGREKLRDRSTHRERLSKLGREEMMPAIAKSSMELVLVPCAVATMLGYHLLLLYRIFRRPHTTMIGYENHNKLAWVERVARATTAPEEAALALSVISDGISASTTLASLCIALASLIGAWVSSSGASPALTTSGGGEATATAKYASLLACFLASFTCFVQSAGCYVHASFLISALGSDAPVSHVQRAVLRGGGFWNTGLRALYLATALLVWVAFGAAAMLACSVLTVAVLYLLDSNSVPMHRHQFMLRSKGLSVTTARPIVVARGAVMMN
ncbi:hypothetical protein BDA96_02G181100 [Sorghum bicolor]|uniref:Uncharacterized protein n=1 Tax=Sorghum bicolor TaxID=4558 RepID=A0A921RP52_SORBI|nr:hypothetical protein BDA96_02G181100 [Sorghum bicolor]